MQSRIVVPFLASLALCASAAMAQEAPPPAPGQMMQGHGSWHMNREDMAKHRAAMCADITPRAVGKLAYLEAKLSLSAVQKPLFERWKSIMLASIKAHEGACANAQFPGPDISVVDLAKRQQQRLETRLADLKAQMPALEALANALNDEQKQTLSRAAMHMMHERAELFEHMRGVHEHMMGDRDAPPPPAN